MPALSCLSSEFYRSSVCAQVQIVNRKSNGADRWISVLVIFAGLDSMTYGQLLLAHVDTTGCAQLFHKICFTNENQDGKGKKPQVKIILPSFPLLSGWIIPSEEETSLVWGSQLLSRACWCFLSPHSLPILINCFVNNHGAMDIMLMSETLKEHMTVCFPLLSFDEGVWVLWG